MEDWKEYKLGDIGTIVGGATPSTKDSSNYDGNIAWITPKDLSNLNCRYISHGERMISQKGFDDCSCRMLPKNSILFSSRAPIGYVAIAQNALCTNQGFKSIIPNNEIVDSLFLYYLLVYYKPVIENMGSGTTFKEVSGSVMKALTVNIPNIDEQKRIAAILSSLDDKIELNRRINRNLEQQAQTLFKAWFVENPNPQWLDGRLSDIASFVGGYSYKGNELVDFSNIGMVTIKNYERSGGFKTDGFKDINPSPKVKSTQYAELFYILVAHTDLTQNADVIGNTELLLSFDHYKHIIFSMDLVKVLPNKNFPYRFLLAAMLKNRIFKSHCLSYVNGTTVLHLSKKALPEYEITIPTDKEAKRMNDILGCYYKQMAEILRENDILENLRNTILPKLMSGKLKINDLNR